MASHILCDCMALATFRFKHLGHHFMQPGDFQDISLSRVGAARCMNIRAAQRFSVVEVHGSLMCPPLLYSILFYIP